MNCARYKPDKYAIFCAIALAFLPLFVRSDYYLHLLILALMWVTIGTAWNLLAGYTGQVSFGDAAFFGTGAYTAGLLSYHLNLSPWLGLPLGALTAMLLALPFGFICFRLRGAYFALATLALNEVLRHIATIWEDLTEGMVGIMIMQDFESKVPYYYIALAGAVMSVGFVTYLMNSKAGYAFLAIREDEDSAMSFGVDTHLCKMLSLCAAAGLTGFAGGFYMNYIGFIDPDTVFSLHDISIMAILVGIVGGVGTRYGPAIGAFVMVLVHEFFRTGGFGSIAWFADLTGSAQAMQIAQNIKGAHLLGFGILVILVIRFMPGGIAGDFHKLLARLKKNDKNMREEMSA